MRIGITERGDASLDFSWENKLWNHEVDGAILITKNLSNTFISRVLDVYSGFDKIIVHCTCTGLGGTEYEPNVPKYKETLDQLRKLIDAGFSANKCVLRIDPIIPMPDTIEKAKAVVDYARVIKLLPDLRVRISVIDMYRHVRWRFVNAGLPTLYDGQQYPSKQRVDYVVDKFCKAYPDIIFETCAEPLAKGDNVRAIGCVSEHDLEILGLSCDIDRFYDNPQGRAGCKCLSCKTELLEGKHRCGHNCLYCYWYD